MRSRILFLVATLATSLTHAQVSLISTQYKLSNGLEVVLHQDRRIPTTTVTVVYRAGSATDEPGKSGLAHLFEHVAGQSSYRFVSEELNSRLIYAVGGGREAATGLDGSYYYVFAPSNHVEILLWLQSGRMGFLAPAITDTIVAREKEIVQNERRQRVDNSIVGNFGVPGSRLMELLFPAPHPYYGNVLGSYADIDRITIDDVRKFAAKYVCPSNATLWIDGDFDINQMRSLVTKYFATIPRCSETLPASIPVQLSPTSEQSVTLRAKARSRQISLAWRMAPAFDSDHAELELLSYVIGDGRGSLLYQNLVEKLNVASDVFCEYRVCKLASVLKCDVVPTSGTSNETVTHHFDAVLDRIRHSGPSEGEVRRASARWLAKLYRGLEGGLSRTATVAHYVYLAGNLSHFERDLERHVSVTPDGIRAAALRFLNPSTRALVILEPGEPAGAKKD